MNIDDDDDKDHDMCCRLAAAYRICLIYDFSQCMNVDAFAVTCKVSDIYWLRSDRADPRVFLA